METLERSSYTVCERRGHPHHEKIENVRTPYISHPYHSY